MSSTTYIHQQNFARHKINLVTLTAGMVKNNFKGTIKKFVASYNEFSFMNSVNETTAYWKQFLYDVLDMVKQLGIPTYFLICADLTLLDHLKHPELFELVKN